MHKNTQILSKEYIVTSSRGLHARAAGHIAVYLAHKIEDGYLKWVGIRDGKKLDYDQRELPDASDLAAMRLETGHRFKVFIKTDEEQGEKILRRIRDILNTPYAEDEKDSSKSEAFNKN